MHKNCQIERFAREIQPTIFSFGVIDNVAKKSWKSTWPFFYTNVNSEAMSGCLNNWSILNEIFLFHLFVRVYKCTLFKHVRFQTCTFSNMYVYEFSGTFPFNYRFWLKRFCDVFYGFSKFERLRTQVHGRLSCLSVVLKWYFSW